MKRIAQTIMILVLLLSTVDKVNATIPMEYDPYQNKIEYTDYQAYDGMIFNDDNMDQFLDFSDGFGIFRAPGGGGPPDTGNETGDDQDDFVNDGPVGDGIVILFILSLIMAFGIHKKRSLNKINK